MEHFETPNLDNAIAIIGLAGRFPGAKNIRTYWQNLCQGVESISFFTREQLEAAGVDTSDYNAPYTVKAGGVLEDIDFFDAAFFDFTPREAEITDPQQRLFLECAWEALEDAGYDLAMYTGRVGVYAGSSMSTYLFQLHTRPDIIQSVDSLQLLIGNDKDHLTTRVCYKLDLRGPGVTVSTTCSTSLVAVHLACQSLLDYHCDMVLAGGVSIQVPQAVMYTYQEGGIISPDGHCRAFDERAGGTIFGNGTGIVVLKRLSDALADKDSIYAVIRGSAINNDGTLKSGYTAPGVEGQAEVISEALASAEVDPATISYIETHGTGTPLGDPIEIAALTQVFRASTDEKAFCAIGSVKTNIGHLDAAAGIAGLIKTVLALKHKVIPPSLHFEQANPHIDFASSPFYVNTKLSAWKAGTTPLRAGVTALGIGGTNAHIVLEEAPVLERVPASMSNQLIVLSARTSSALETISANLAHFIAKHPDIDLADIAYTTQTGRRAFPYRRIVVCSSNTDLIYTLEKMPPQRVFNGKQQEDSSSIVFLFPGQGTQYVHMAQDLYREVRLFRDCVDNCAGLLGPVLGFDLRDVLYPTAGEEEQASFLLNQTRVTQPALFVIEYALAKLWMHWGIQPQAMIGHSIGEYVAACLAEVLSLEDALKLVALRGALMQKMPTGSMLAVPLSLEEVERYLAQEEELSLSALNGPELCVVAGPAAAINNLRQHLTEKGINCPLRVG